ncbi:DUF1835 domain-containing protein [Gracilibacillus oryzae]|uniref:DUF1835 domain-containing protein n=1 Tax=Gracilibacillus oryzae TaxID=1672701 RepID=A0A7C8KRH0_9BACI|nr:DUF1835 domain-containing protein [Gracilibacillus oryzae]KAB8138126.1 DUF1835 domain-containing protein [Gracilibacillus oryzae]
MIPIITKINTPYIYFLSEADLVFVYPFHFTDYITSADLSEIGTTYKINDKNEFQTFDHHDYEESKEMGFSYFVKEETLNYMVEEINKQIQKYKNQKGIDNQSDPVHIVTSESVAGSLKVALKRPKHVIGFPDSFAIGPLWKLETKEGQTYRSNWLLDHINMEDDEYQIKWNNALREIIDISVNVPIYLWYGNNADEQSGLRFYLYLLRDKTNLIYLINTTELYEKFYASKEIQGICNSGQLEPNQLAFIFNETAHVPLSFEQRSDFQEQWEKLAQSQDVLRIWINNTVQPLEEEHYDSFILSTIDRLHQKQKKQDFILTADVIGELLIEMEEYIDYAFLEYRIRHLIYSGILELKGVPKTMRHYSVKLRS